MNIHVVQPGETISSIAEIYGVSVDKIIRDNELINPYNLVPGQTIVIVYPEQTYTVQAGDTLENIANTFNITIMQLLRNNPYLSSREFISPGDELVISYNTTREITTIGYAYPFINSETLRKTLPYLTYLSVFNFRATDEGEIVSYYDDTEIIQMSKDYDTIPLIMMTTLTAQGEINYEVAYKLLLSEDFQNKQLDNLVNIIRERGYLGVNFVFYTMNEENQILYQNFIKKASDRLINEGYYVYVTINPNIKNVDGEVTFEKIDYSIISNYVQSTIFLQFIWGSNYGPPSPVSSIYDLRNFVEYAIELVPPNKLIVGKPIIAYDWELPYRQQNSAVSLTIDSAISLASDTGAYIQFDEISQTPFFEYTESSISFPTNHIVWFIDARSIAALLNLVIEFGLAGTGIWSIMIYSPQLWLIINSQYEVVKYLPIVS